MGMGFRLVDLHMKDTLVGESFAVSRNWPAQGQQGPQMSKHQKCRRIKRHD